MAALPRASRHEPGAAVDPDDVYTPSIHRGAVDPERPLVIGNRGAGKSFWSHALLNADIRSRLAQTYRQSSLRTADVVIGFNGAERVDPVAPSPEVIEDAIRRNLSPDLVWRAVLARALVKYTQYTLPTRFSNVLSWVREDIERYQELMTEADQNLSDTGKILIVVFDALDRLPGGWQQIRELTRALMQRALAIKSFRAVRMKIFMRPDQFADRTALFGFPDGSKIVNDHVALHWQPFDLYGLLFYSLNRVQHSKNAINTAIEEVSARPVFDSQASGGSGSADDQAKLVSLIAGPYMGTDRRRGRVYTWVPTHLADAYGDCSPRTFLTAWRVAAEHSPAPNYRAVDHLGINEGVRQASSDRLTELSEDYPWVRTVLEPLRDAAVPIERSQLENIWRTNRTVERVIADARRLRWLAPIELELGDGGEAGGPATLVQALETIGVVQERDNGRINVPDIFRVEAGIKRRGGVAIPRR